MKSFEELLVYQKSINFTVEVYKITREFPKTETYALADQLRRAAVSVPSNIAEGVDRRTSKEFLQFLRMAFASSSEVWAQLTIAHKLNYVTRKELILTMNNLE
jgi:four helix bundle protein